ncbi:MAG: hypothetical protein HY958_04210 [Bacteroidia bacterium]|nr:hypothetical protein [Bacteroidia bacterium]
MKTKIVFFILCMVLSVFIFAQSPHAFKYQAVVRNSGGEVIPNQQVSLRVSLLQGSVGGTAVYMEQHSATTNAFGLVNINVGNGTIITGSFASIDWSAGPYFIKIELDATGGSTFTEMGVTQLLSVPYALYAASGVQGPQGQQGPQGVSGQNGISVVWLGTFSTAPTNPVVNNAYYNSADKKSYVFDGNGWQIIAQDGAQGLQGLPGNTAVFIAGQGINISGDTISNTNPDDTITLTGAGATTVTGMYPHFNIFSTDNNTTYSAGMGLFLSGTTFHVNVGTTIGTIASGNHLHAEYTASGSDGYVQFRNNTMFGGNPLFFWDNNTLRLGIGTSTPSATLHVFGSFRYVNDNEGPGKVLMSDATGNVDWVMPAITSISGTQNYVTKFTSPSTLGNSLFYENGNYMGLGTTTPVGRLVIQGDTLSADSVPLFEVKEKGGKTVFVVWPDGAHVYVNENAAKAQNRGSFAVSGRSSTKTFETDNYFKISSATSLDTVTGARVLWYPKKEAFLSGRVLVTSPVDVGTNSMSTGYNSKAKGNWSQAFGYQATALGNYSTAIGKNAQVNSDNSFAFGDGVTASAVNSFAFGKSSSATGSGSYSFGNMAQATATDAFSFGVNSHAHGNNSYAFGYNSSTTASGSYAFGQSSSASGSGSFAFGVNVIAGSSSPAATNCYAFGKNASATGDESYALGSNAQATQLNAYALGAGANASGQYSYAFGAGAQATGQASFAFGSAGSGVDSSGNPISASTLADHNSSLAFGQGSQSTGDYAVSVGISNYATNSYSIAMGYSCNTTGYGASTFGHGNYASGNYATALGHNNSATSYACFMVGQQGRDYGTSSTSWVDTDPIFIVGKGNGSSNIPPPPHLVRSNAMVILKNGNVGIGTNSPTFKLEVSNDIKVHGSATLEDNLYFTNGAPSIINGNGKSFIQCGWDGTWGDFTALNSAYDWSSEFEPGSVIASENYPLVVCKGTWGSPFYAAVLSVNPGGDLWTSGSVNASVLTGPSGYGVIQDRSSDNNISFDWDGSTLHFVVDATNVKNFIIDHPVDKNKYLVHTTLEGPENAVFYRGTGKLIAGKATVNLPDYFQALVQEGSETITLTAKGKTPYLLSADNLLGNTFEVFGEIQDGEFYWRVEAKRKDVPDLFVEPDRKDIEVKGFGPYKFYNIKNKY